MIHPVLSRIPFFGKFVDERFLEYRRRSTSLAGLAGVLLIFVLLEYHIFHDHIIEWELFAVLLVMAVVKVSMMLWYRTNG
jgi:hypothetical protein